MAHTLKRQLSDLATKRDEIKERLTAEELSEDQIAYLEEFADPERKGIAQLCKNENIEKRRELC